MKHDTPTVFAVTGGLVLFILIGLSAFTAADPEQRAERVQITADHPAALDQVRNDVPVRHDFGNVVTATLSQQQVNALEQRNGVSVESVQKVRIFHHRDGHDGGPGGGDDDDGTRVTPSDQTPYGIEHVYNDTELQQTSGGSGVDVAVLDTGVNRDHPDLTNRVEQCVDFTKGGPFNTKIDDGTCDDGNGHGTHVSGTALADAGSDDAGIYGVAPDADLFAYKVLNDQGSGYADDIAAAIDYAADNGAEVVSMSLGASSQSDLIADAISRNKDTVLFVAAAGNDGPDLDTMGWPGANNNTIGVAATDVNFAVADFSSRGLDTAWDSNQNRLVEVAAPGKHIESTWNDGEYNTISGTSMATPHVSGYAAKIWGSVEDADGDGKIDDVREHIRNRAEQWDITDGKHATTWYDPAAGKGLPTVAPSG